MLKTLLDAFQWIFHKRFGMLYWFFCKLFDALRWIIEFFIRVLMGMVQYILNLLVKLFIGAFKFVIVGILNLVQIIVKRFID